MPLFGTNLADFGPVPKCAVTFAQKGDLHGSVGNVRATIAPMQLPGGPDLSIRHLHATASLAYRSHPRDVEPRRYVQILFPIPLSFGDRYVDHRLAGARGRRLENLRVIYWRPKRCACADANVRQCSGSPRFAFDETRALSA